MAVSRRYNAKTPSGEKYSEIYFLDDTMFPVDEQVATRCVINE